MTLPNAAAAAIDPIKIRRYLLSDAHPIGRFKAAYFRGLGFAADDWEVLREALLAHARERTVVTESRNPYGQKFVVGGILVGPTGRGDVVSVWIVRADDNVPWFVTAYPR